jgi:NAD(P)-dependent dehydrogenase (short-subunit alcohol dehydrogenase family)
MAGDELMAGRMQDRVVVVTGAGQHIGLAYAQRFLEEGAKVAIAEIDDARSEAALKHLAGIGFDGDDTVVAIHTDIGDEASTQACAERVVDHFGRLDVLVNNAGLYQDWNMADQSFDYLKRVMEVNWLGTWLMTRAVAPQMVAQGEGRIINQASGAAYNYRSVMSSPEFDGLGSDAYAQSKWGVVGLTKFTAAQLGRWGITVNCIAPGVIGTPSTLDKIPASVLDDLVASQALPVQLQAEDLTGTALYFAGDDGRWITGQVICVDGGRVMPA